MHFVFIVNKQSDNIDPIDNQYIITASILIAIWLMTDIFGLIEKNNWMFWSRMMQYEPHRFITSALIHANATHLLANLGGIVIARVMFKRLWMRSNYLFLLLTIFLIPISNLLQWLWEGIIVSNPNAATLGFSGVVYGVNAFLLLCAINGKNKFFGIPINIHKNYQVQQSMIVLTIIGQIWNFSGGVSIVGHNSGFVAGIILFLIS